MYTKTITLLTAIILSTFNLFGQVPTARGNLFLGGTAGLTASNSQLTVTNSAGSDVNEGPTSFTINASPSLGYFVADNFGLGFNMDYSLSTVTIGEDRTIDSDFLVGPMARYYFPYGKNKALFMHLTTGFGSSTDDLVIENTEVTSVNTIGKVGFGPGITIFSSNAVGIEALALYNFVRTNSDIDTDAGMVTTTSLTNEFDFQIGINFYLDRVRPATTR